MIRADLHVHSHHSAKPANWLAKQFNIPESFTEPMHIYRSALERGMTHVTITDHNVIAGCLEIAHLPHTFISCELTTRFPEDQCKVHVLAHHITERQFEEMVAIRRNIYELVNYFDRNDIANAIAHPLYSVNDKLTRAHFEKLLLLFNVFELNGFRSPEVNDTLRHIIGGLSDDRLERLASAHDIANPKTTSSRKTLISGSDDHSGMFVARSHTYNPGDSLECLFTQRHNNVAAPAPSEPAHLGYAIYSILFQHIEKRVDLQHYIDRDDGLRNIATLLLLTPPPSGSTFSSIVKWFAGQRLIGRHDAEALFRNTFKRLSESTRNLTPENVPYRWFDTISTAIDESVGDLLVYTVQQLRSGNVFNIFRSIGSISSLYFLSIPYYIAYKSFQQTRLFAESLESSAPRKAKAVHFSDTYYEINGVAKSLQQMTIAAKRLGLDYTFVTCADCESKHGERVFRPMKVYDLPEYPEMKLACPPILEMLDYCFRENFTHVHAATPGPIGLIGLLIARILNRPFYTTYHTHLPEYAAYVTGDQSLEGLTWSYMRWFYNQADKVFAPSQAFKDELVANGIDEARIELMPRGIDTVRFNERDWENDNDRFRLLYVGRVSREKNLDVLGDAFRQLGRDEVSLSIVGDGPYREELMAKLSDLSVDMPGYVEGDELVRRYKEADLFVFPSTTDTFGNVILEAHACGVPTIVTDKGGPHENVIPGETGLVVPGGNAVALKDAISSLLDRATLKRMGQKARQVVATRGFDAVFLQYWKAYEDQDPRTDGDNGAPGALERQEVECKS
jgi:glycosyltransferase involved in cell wall biosynthesis